jgi:hypothetical protein
MRSKYTKIIGAFLSRRASSSIASRQTYDKRPLVDVDRPEKFHMRETPSTKNGARAPQGPEVGGLFSVPRLEEVAAEPGKAWKLDRRATRVLTTAGISAVSALIVRFLEFAGDSESDGRRTLENTGEKHWITPDEASQIIRESPRWFYRNAGRLPFVRRVSRKKILISAPEMHRWIDARRI